MHTGLKAIDEGHVVRWKIESDEELKLAYDADMSVLEKKKYCDFYRHSDPVYYAKGVEMAKSVIKKHNGVETGLTEEQLIEDMIYSLHRFGFNYSEYFWFKLYNLSTFGREGFISDKMRFEYYMELNTREGNELLRDKGRAFERLKAYYKRECLAISSIDDRINYESFAQKYKKFFYKPLASDSAMNCHVVDSKFVNFDHLIAEGPFIIEEIIQQAGDFAEFYPDAVNLIRIPVLTAKDGEVHLMGPFLTLGQGEMKAVNAGAGGIIATIDPETGGVIGKGWVENSEVEFAFHPQTNKRIIGYHIPEWEDAVNMCKEASKLIPECKYIGFDLAQTKDGWVMIEANCYAQFLGQRNTSGLRRQMLEYLK